MPPWRCRPPNAKPPEIRDVRALPTIQLMLATRSTRDTVATFEVDGLKRLSGPQFVDSPPIGHPILIMSPDPPSVHLNKSGRRHAQHPCTNSAAGGSAMT